MIRSDETVNMEIGIALTAISFANIYKMVACITC